VAREARQRSATARAEAYKPPKNGWSHHGLRERVKHGVITASEGLDFLSLPKAYGEAISPSIVMWLVMWLAKREKKSKRIKKMEGK
jgi:hypothetical protein